VVEDVALDELAPRDSKTAFAEAAQRTREMATAVTPLAEFGNDGRRRPDLRPGAARR
jgi:plasmid stabilization system protein ParE